MTISAIEKTVIIECVEEIIARYTRAGLPMWPESEALLDKAPLEFARYLQRSLNLGEYRHNKAQCGYCKQIIASKTIHHYNTCDCGKTSVDGGSNYLRRAGDNWNDLSEQWPWITNNAE